MEVITDSLVSNNVAAKCKVIENEMLHCNEECIVNQTPEDKPEELIRQNNSAELKSKDLSVLEGAKTVLPTQCREKQNGTHKIKYAAQSKEELSRAFDLVRSMVQLLSPSVEVSVESAEEDYIVLSPKDFCSESLNTVPSIDLTVDPASIDWSGDFVCQVNSVLSRIKLTQEDLANFSILYRHLVTALQAIWPGCTARPFGSATTGLGIVGSDVDCFISLPRSLSSTEPGSLVMQARNFLAGTPDLFANILAIPHANTPIVKFLHKPTNTCCDVSLNNALGVRNSALVKFLFITDPRLQTLALLLKYWARVHSLSGTRKLSNYTLVMMLIFYLQQPHVSILPPIRWLRTFPVYVECWDTSFCQDLNRFPTNKNTSPVQDLLGGFFKYYSEFYFKRFVVCPYLGVPVEKELFVDLNRLPGGLELYKQNLINKFCLPLKVSSPICVQDPFDQSHNIAVCILHTLRLKEYFQYAADVYAKGKANGHVDFLRTILLTKPGLMQMDIISNSMMCDIRIPSNIFRDIPRAQWESRAKGVFELIFIQVLKMRLNKESEKTDDKNGKTHVKYNLLLERKVWEKTELNLVQANAPNRKKQQKIKEELQKSKEKITGQVSIHLVLNTDRNILVYFQLTTPEDIDNFKEFSKFLVKDLVRWVQKIIKPDAAQVEKDANGVKKEERRNPG